jgi:hypothetical protein
MIVTVAAGIVWYNWYWIISIENILVLLHL